jgi:hypothetical protein
MFFVHNTGLTIVLLTSIVKIYNMQMLSTFGLPSLLRPKGAGLRNGHPARDIAQPAPGPQT